MRRMKHCVNCISKRTGRTSLARVLPAKEKKQMSVMLDALLDRRLFDELAQAGIDVPSFSASMVARA